MSDAQARLLGRPFRDKRVDGLSSLEQSVEEVDMKISGADLLAEAHAFHDRHPGVAGVVEAKHKLPKFLMYALGSRETNLSAYYETHAGDGGHGHGTWQLDDRSHVITNMTVAQFAEVAGQMMADLIAHFKGDLKAALSAYNGGVGGATHGLREGDSDKYTTGHDYGQDVIDRMHFLQTHYK